MSIITWCRMQIFSSLTDDRKLMDGTIICFAERNTNPLILLPLRSVNTWTLSIKLSPPRWTTSRNSSVLVTSSLPNRYRIMMQQNFISRGRLSRCISTHHYLDIFLMLTSEYPSTSRRTTTSKGYHINRCACKPQEDGGFTCARIYEDRGGVCAFNPSFLSYLLTLTPSSRGTGVCLEYLLKNGAFSSASPRLSAQESQTYWEPSSE